MKTTSAYLDTERKRTCAPKKDIAFVKTHKCASSTIQNMLIRYADQNNLTLVLPLEPNNNYLSQRTPFSRRSIATAPWGENGYNILCHHILYNHAEVKAIMPPDTVYVTILREPVKLFESLFSYVHFENVYNMNIEQFLNNTHNITKRLHGHLGRNQMLFDLGFPIKYFNNTAKVKQEISAMEKRFDLILIAEYFDESVILLKDLMCWDFNDIITFKLNSRKESKRHELSEHSKRRIREWSAADVMLYGYFLKIFKQRLVQYGEQKMKRDIEILRQRRNEWFSFCIEGIYDSTKLSKSSKLWSRDVWGFEVKKSVHNDTCDNLATGELQQTSKMRNKQLLRSLPFHLQSKDEYKLLVYANGPVPDISNLTLKDKSKVIRVARLVFPGRTDYLHRRPILKKPLTINLS